MKNQDAKEKKFRELSEEELEKVTGGLRLPSTLGGGGENTMTCFVQSCPQGHKQDRDSCQCVEEPNTDPIVALK